MSAQLKADGTWELEIRREFAFPRELVFEAWIKPEHLAQWMGPTEDIRAEVTEADCREGGSYRYGFIEEGEPVKYVHGVYREIIRPEKLMFTWIWEEPLPDAGVESLVTIDFLETASGTEVILKHQKFAQKETCEKHHWGWSGTLDKLAAYLPKVH